MRCHVEYILEECQPRGRSHPSANQPPRFLDADVDHRQDEIRAIRDVGIYSPRSGSVGAVSGRDGVCVTARARRVPTVKPY